MRLKHAFLWDGASAASHEVDAKSAIEIFWTIHALEVLRGPLVMLAIFSFLLLACLIFFVHFLRMRKSERGIEPTAAAPSQPNCPGVSCSDHSAGSYLINRPFSQGRENTGDCLPSLHVDRGAAVVNMARQIIKPVFSRPREMKNKSLIPGKLAHSPSFYSKSMKRKLCVCP